jgi:ubiquinone/menaquinone biosynthesis C-methylase UbiE
VRTEAANRLTEVARYERAYLNPQYRLGDRRAMHIHEHLRRVPKGSLLDVSTGRGEVLRAAREMGFGPVKGTEAVGYLCDGINVVQALGHALPFPDASFDVVTMFDVMEHLIPEDTCLVCEELRRVARQRILMTVCNEPSSFGSDDGDLHINRRASYDVWFRELQDHFAPWVVIRHGVGRSFSEMFEVVPNAI